MKIKTVLFIFFFIVYSGHTHAACKEITISYANNWYPITFDQPKLKAKGIALEMLRKAFYELGISVILKGDLPWKRQLSMLDVGEIDAIAALHFNEDRKKNFKLSPPFYQSQVHIFKRTTSSLEFSSLEDLIGYTGVASRGASFGDKFDDFAEEHLNVLRINGTEHMLEMVSNKRADYFVSPLKLGYHLIQKAGLTGLIVVSGPSIDEKPIHTAFSKKSACSDVVEGFSEILRRPDMQEFIRKIANQY